MTHTIKLFKETADKAVTTHICGITDEQLDRIADSIFVFYPSAHTATIRDDEFGLEYTIHNFKLCRHYVVECNGVSKQYVNDEDAMREYFNLKRFFDGSGVRVEYKCMLNGERQYGLISE